MCDDTKNRGSEHTVGARTTATCLCHHDTCERVVLQSSKRETRQHLHGQPKSWFSCADTRARLGGRGADEARMDQPRKLDARDVAAGREDAVELPYRLGSVGKVIREESAACQP